MSRIHEHDNELQLQEKVEKPKMYRVVMLNDHFTTMDFVVTILVRIFHKDIHQATEIMYDIHEKGSGLCGIFSKDIAETKVSHVHKEAKFNNFPLKCIIEPE